MATYSYAQMMQLWIKAGGPRSLAPIAAAIGEAESGGNASALNPDDNHGTQSSFGIWQISNGTHAPPSPNWANPAVNAQLAVAKWKGAGQSFSPWGTYDSGAYKAYLSPGTTPDPNVPGSPDQLTAQTTAAQAVDCLVGNPFSASVGPLSVSAGPSCLFTKSNARAFIGAGLLGLGVIVAFDGGLWIMAGLALRAAGLAGAVPSIGIPVPGTGRLGGKSPVDTTTAAPDGGGSAQFVAQQVQPPRQGLPAAGPKVIPGEVISSAEIPAIAA